MLTKAALKPELTSWELLRHCCSTCQARFYYLNQEESGGGSGQFLVLHSLWMRLNMESSVQTGIFYQEHLTMMRWSQKHCGWSCNLRLRKRRENDQWTI